MKFVLDASVAVSWFLPDEPDPYPTHVLEKFPEDQAQVPSIWASELANVLLMAERRKRLTSTETASVLARLQHLPIEVVSLEVDVILAQVLPLAREHRLSVYDAVYLALAIREQIPLATLDQDLIRAARTADVPIYLRPHSP